MIQEQSKTMQVWDLCSVIIRNHPYWPSTFSTCYSCGKHSARGGGKCALCYEKDLAELVGVELAHKFHEAVKNQSSVLREVMDSVKETVDKD